MESVAEGGMDGASSQSVSERERAVRSGVQDQAMLHEWRILPTLQVGSMTSTMECLGEVMARGGVSWAVT